MTNWPPDALSDSISKNNQVGRQIGKIINVTITSDITASEAAAFERYCSRRAFLLSKLEYCNQSLMTEIQEHNSVVSRGIESISFTNLKNPSQNILQSTNQKTNDILTLSYWWGEKGDAKVGPALAGAARPYK